MQIVYNSQNYHVVEYDGTVGYELINKPAGVGIFLSGDVAVAFRDNFARVVAEDSSADSIDDFLGGFDALMNQPAVMRPGLNNLARWPSRRFRGLEVFRQPFRKLKRE